MTEISEAQVLQKKCDSTTRRIKEATWIRRRAPNTMNRDEGPIISVMFMTH